MADALALLDELEASEAAKKPQKQQRKSKLASSYVSAGARKTRSTSRGPTSRPARLEGNLQAPAGNSSKRSPSLAPSIGGESSRRISFAEPKRPGARKLWIPTKTESLASGFVYDQRLNKYGVSEDEWKEFNKEITAAADLRSPTWMWPLKRSGVIQKVKTDLQYVESSYDGDVKKVLKKYNGFWRRYKGFGIWLELPTPKGQVDLSDDVVGDTAEDKEKAKKDAKRFRIVISSSDKERADGRPASVYSRHSSLSKSIRGEGMASRHGDDADSDVDNDNEDDNGSVSPDDDNENAILSPLSPRSDYQDAMSNVSGDELKSPTIRFETDVR